jgi:hypothetical protein
MTVKRLWTAPWRPFALLVIVCWAVALATCFGG